MNSRDLAPVSSSECPSAVLAQLALSHKAAQTTQGDTVIPRMATNAQLAGEALLSAFRDRYRQFSNLIRQSLHEFSDCVQLGRLGDDLDEYQKLVNEVGARIPVS